MATKGCRFVFLQPTTQKIKPVKTHQPETYFL